MTTKIEWCDAVWNPVTGCSHVSEGCRYCYAEREFPRLAKGLKVPAYQGRTFTDVACHPECLDEPLKRKKPTRYFVNSMSDLFHPAVPFDFIDRVFAVMALAPHHTFIILTKRPERALEYLTNPIHKNGGIAETTRDNGFLIEREMRIREATGQFLNIGSADHLSPVVFPLPNVWLGVSVEDQKTADERIPVLLQCPAAIWWVSYEPALGPVNFAPWLPGFCNSCGEHLTGINKEMMTCSHCEWISEPPWLQWCVCGGESGPNARPSHPDWFRQVRDDCVAAGVPFFFKQWGEWAPREIEPQHCRYGEFHGPGDWIESCLCEEGTAQLYRVGKKRSGRLLDGVKWNQFPEVKP